MYMILYNPADTCVSAEHKLVSANVRINVTYVMYGTVPNYCRELLQKYTTVHTN